MDKIARIVHGEYDGSRRVRGRAIIILSTYNGEKYLRQQLDSVLNQQGIDCSILVRDDGSTDGTVHLLKEYAKQHSNFSFYLGANKGVIGSFNDLIMRPELNGYEYIAFCDQDDIWDIDKLVIATDYIGKDNSIPIMYCSNLTLVDSNLMWLGPMRNPIDYYSASMSLVQNIGTGCTQVFNKKALELYRSGISCRMEMHDYWMTLVCIYLGRVIYDNNAHIKYRQHRNNVIGAKKKSMIKAVSHIIKQKHEVRANMIKDFIDTYVISPEDKKILRQVAYYNESLFSRLKMLSLKYKGISRNVTIGFKVRALIGKLY